MKNQHADIKQNDIVKIVSDCPEQGRFAKVLRVQKEKSGETLYTLKVNNYWNSSEMIKRYGAWDGQLWIAMAFSDREILLKKQDPQHKSLPVLRNAV